MEKKCFASALLGQPPAGESAGCHFQVMSLKLHGTPESLAFLMDLRHYPSQENLDFQAVFSVSQRTGLLCHQLSGESRVLFFYFVMLFTDTLMQEPELHYLVMLPL